MVDIEHFHNNNVFMINLSNIFFNLMMLCCYGDVCNLYLF